MEETKMTFYTWLMRYKKENSPRGDLAREVHKDKNNKFFKNANFKAKKFMRSYLESLDANNNCLFTFDECYEEYQVEVRKHRQ